MRAPLFILVVLCLSKVSLAQKDARSLEPPHRAALATYLNAHKNCDFLPESVFEDKFGRGEIAFVKKNLGSHFQRPFYIVADFNADKRNDFAMLLGATISGRRQYRIIVWNGTKRGYRVAWQDAQTQLGMFSLSWEKKGKQRLVFGPPESDAGFLLTPAGSSYIPEGG
ncbi:MAG: hypothetical protein ACR2HJ_05185 [Fimbriimonadales bacterium]